METAVIIAGGRGERLKPLTDEIPKTLLPLGGKPILYWIVKWLKSFGVKKLVIGVAYKKELIRSFFEQNSNFDIDVQFSEHSVEGGTAEGFKKAIKFVKDENFVAMNSDELTNMNLENLWQKHIQSGLSVTMALSYYNAKLSVVKIDQNDRVISIEYGRKIKEILVSIGIYIFNKSVIEQIPEVGSIEDTLFPFLSSNRQLGSYILSKNEEWVTVNNLKELNEASIAIEKWGKSNA